MKTFHVYINTVNKGSVKAEYPSQAAHIAMKNNGMDKASMIEVHSSDKEYFYFSCEIRGEIMYYTRPI